MGRAQGQNNIITQKQSIAGGRDRVRGGDVRGCGIPDGPLMGIALSGMPRALKSLGRDAALQELSEVAKSPRSHADNPFFSAVALRMIEVEDKANLRFVERDVLPPMANFCPEAEAGALLQINNARRIPSATRLAVMPDAHQGYGLPIGGVMETEGTIIPYAVGVDIACRMRMSILDIDPDAFESNNRDLKEALLKETHFGMGAAPTRRADHDVIDDERWNLTPLSKSLRDKAWKQMASSGTGNHFVEWGTLELAEPDLGLQPGRYVSLLSHSGSRGAGAQIASYYSKLARQMHPELPKDLQNLSWLDLDHESGQEYLALMRLMGDYAAANHSIIHERVSGHLKAGVLAGIENHHNFAWVEERDGKEYVVHRKGATPAGVGVLGVIPGSMADPGYVVRGRGEETSIESASHGAGRAMSRTAATEKFNWKMIRPLLAERQVELLSAGIDENPFCYKNIETVMAAQTDLVDVVARFDPRIVRMADAGERPED